MREGDDLSYLWCQQVLEGTPASSNTTAVRAYAFSADPLLVNGDHGDENLRLHE